MACGDERQHLPDIAPYLPNPHGCRRRTMRAVRWSFELRYLSPCTESESDPFKRQSDRRTSCALRHWAFRALEENDLLRYPQSRRLIRVARRDGNPIAVADHRGGGSASVGVTPSTRERRQGENAAR